MQRQSTGRLSRLVENRSEGPEFEQWDAQRGCSRPRPSIFLSNPSENFPLDKGPGRNLALPRRFLGETVDNPGRKTLYCGQRFRTMELVNGASGNPFRVASCGWMPRPRHGGFHHGWRLFRVLWPNDRRRQRESVSARCKRVNGIVLRLGDGSLGRTGEIAREILCIVFVSLKIERMS